MSGFPECLRRRGQAEGELLNGQVCHRIYGHGGNCLFDRPAEFEPVRQPSNFRTNSDLAKLTQSSRILPNLKPNPRAEA